MVVFPASTYQFIFACVSTVNIPTSCHDRTVTTTIAVAGPIASLPLILCQVCWTWFHHLSQLSEEHNPLLCPPPVSKKRKSLKWPKKCASAKVCCVIPRGDLSGRYRQTEEPLTVWGWSRCFIITHSVLMTIQNWNVTIPVQMIKGVRASSMSLQSSLTWHGVCVGTHTWKNAFLWLPLFLSDSCKGQ